MKSSGSSGKIVGSKINEKGFEKTLNTTTQLQILSALILDTREHVPIIVTTNSNSWTMKWGCQIINVRDRFLLGAYATCTVANIGSWNLTQFPSKRLGPCIVPDICDFSLENRSA